MAKNAKNEITVGLTLLVVMGLTIHIVIALADFSDWFVARKHITVKQPYQTDLQGLIAGSPIYLGGAKVGLITNTRVEPP